MTLQHTLYNAKDVRIKARMHEKHKWANFSCVNVRSCTHVIKSILHTLIYRTFSHPSFCLLFLRLFGSLACCFPTVSKKDVMPGAQICVSVCIHLCVCVYVYVYAFAIRNANITRWRYEDWTLHFIHVKNRARAHFIVSRAQI